MTEIGTWTSDRRLVNFEALAAKDVMERCIRRLDVAHWMPVARRHVGGLLMLRQTRGEADDPRSRVLAKGVVPEVSAADCVDAAAAACVQNAALALAIAAVVRDQARHLTTIGIDLKSAFSGVPVLATLADVLAGAPTQEQNGPLIVGSRLAELAKGDVELTPSQILEAQCRIVDWARASEFSQTLADPLGHWVVSTWRRLMTERRFQLRSPFRTCPSIETACASAEGGLARAASVLLAVEDATRIELSPEFRALLRAFPSSVKPYCNGL